MLDTAPRSMTEQARSLMLNTPFPQELELAIANAYKSF